MIGFLTRIVFCCRRPSCPSCPSSSSSVRPPSRPSVAVVLCPSVRSVRPSPSSVVVKLRIQGRMQIFEQKHQNMSPTATGLGASDRARSGVFLAGRKLLCVLKKLVLRPKHFCFRMLVPMSMLIFLDITKTLLYGM